jgi:hypothetical protein
MRPLVVPAGSESQPPRGMTYVLQSESTADRSSWQNDCLTTQRDLVIPGTEEGLCPLEEGALVALKKSAARRS